MLFKTRASIESSLADAIPTSSGIVYFKRIGAMVSIPVPALNIEALTGSLPFACIPPNITCAE